MNAAENRKNLMFGVPGILLQLVGNVMYRGLIGGPGAAGNPLWLIVALVGTVLLIVGLAFYAKAKGYHPAFGLLGLLSLIGLIILAVMPDKLKRA